jgi:hypothetical protein
MDGWMDRWIDIFSKSQERERDGIKKNTLLFHFLFFFFFAATKNPNPKTGTRTNKLTGWIDEWIDRHNMQGKNTTSKKKGKKIEKKCHLFELVWNLSRIDCARCEMSPLACSSVKPLDTPRMAPVTSMFQNEFVNQV